MPASKKRKAERLKQHGAPRESPELLSDYFVASIRDLLDPTRLTGFNFMGIQALTKEQIKYCRKQGYQMCVDEGEVFLGKQIWRQAMRGYNLEKAVTPVAKSILKDFS